MVACNNIDDVTRFANALRGLENARIELNISPLGAAVLVAQLSLALRHPRNRGPARKIARILANHLLDLLPTEVQSMLRPGFEPQPDANGT